MIKLKIFIVFIFCLFIELESDAQKYEDVKCHIKSPPSHQTESQIKTYLQNQKVFIKLKLIVNQSFKNDSAYKKWVFNNSTEYDTNTINTELLLDSIILYLSNGLAWNIDNEPPQRPHWFIFKLFSKKGRTHPDVEDRIKYLEYCSRWEYPDSNNCEIEEKFVVYATIKIENVDTFKAMYEIITHPETLLEVIYKSLEIL